MKGNAFSAAFCVAYVWAVATNHPLFLYYPLHGDFRWGMQPLPSSETNGPAMAWYGIMATAGIAAALSALCAPRGLSRALASYQWLFPLGAMLVCAFLVRGLF